MGIGAARGRRRAGLHVRRQGGADRNPLSDAADQRPRHHLQGSRHPPELARGHLRQPGQRARRRRAVTAPRFNRRGVWAIYRFEMHRFLRTIWTGLATPVITTSLYFVVFGSAIGSRMSNVGGIPYGSFIVPGLMMLSLFNESIFNASFGIHMPRFTGTIYEILSIPLSAFKTVLGYVGAAATKALIVALVILATVNLFVHVHIEHPLLMALFLLLVALTFCLFGFI